MRLGELLEATWAQPKTGDKMNKLRSYFKSSIPANISIEFLQDILGNDELMGRLQDFAITNPEDPAQPIVKEFLLAQMPKLHDHIFKTDDCLNNCDGGYSPLGHEYEEY